MPCHIPLLTFALIHCETGTRRRGKRQITRRDVELKWRFLKTVFLSYAALKATSSSHRKLKPMVFLQGSCSTCNFKDHSLISSINIMEMLSAYSGFCFSIRVSVLGCLDG
ncbi:uncharacterized protein [Montipora capricornis]|uniref:uncharacterized protein n=1 Tax=Montipora capricornis TaxID=246305 RepID=UPI0035F19337